MWREPISPVVRGPSQAQKRCSPQVRDRAENQRLADLRARQSRLPLTSDQFAAVSSATHPPRVFSVQLAFAAEDFPQR